MGSTRGHLRLTSTVVVTNYWNMYVDKKESYFENMQADTKKFFFKTKWLANEKFQISNSFIP